MPPSPPRPRRRPVITRGRAVAAILGAATGALFVGVRGIVPEPAEVARGVRIGGVAVERG
jgi:hypothetical protein